MRRARALTLLALAGLLATLLVAPAGAEPSSDEVRGQLQTAEERLQDLQMRAGAVIEDYNEAQAALDEVTAEQAETEGRLAELTVELEVLSELAGDYARRLHKLGPTLELSAVFVAADVEELGTRASTLRRIMDGQRADFEALDAVRSAVTAEEERLAEQRERAQAQQAEVADRRSEVEAVLASQQAELDALQEELAEAEEREAEEERRRQAERERRAEAERERQAEAERERQAEAEAERQAARQSSTSGGSGGSGGSSGGSGGSGGSSGGSSGDGSSSSGSAPSTRSSAQKAVDTALDQVGKPYQWGGSGPDSFDCSGLTSYAWRAAGVEITRTSRSQWDFTTRISRSELQAGDLVFYSRDGTRDGIGHVAMYTGRGNEVVEAPYSGNNVRVRSDGLSRSDILGYGRV